MKSLALLLPLALLLGCGTTPEATAPSSAVVSGSPATPDTAAAPPAERTERGWAKMATGCQDFTVVVSHASKKRVLVIRGSRRSLGLIKVGDSKTVDVSASVRMLDLEVAVYDAPGGEQHYCNDAVPADAPKKTAFLSAASGTVTIKLTTLRSDHDYAIDVTVSGVTIRNGPDLETVADVTYSDVHVGWLPG